MKYLYFLLSLIAIISVLGIIYWDFFFFKPLDNPILTGTGTGIYSPEVELEQLGNNLHITGFVLRGSSEEFSHFEYSVSGNDIYLSGYMKPISILFHRHGKPLDIILKNGKYNIFYKNSDGSVRLIKSINLVK